MKESEGGEGGLTNVYRNHFNQRQIYIHHGDVPTFQLEKTEMYGQKVRREREICEEDEEDGRRESKGKKRKGCIPLLHSSPLLPCLSTSPISRSPTFPSPRPLFPFESFACLPPCLLALPACLSASVLSLSLSQEIPIIIIIIIIIIITTTTTTNHHHHHQSLHEMTDPDPSHRIRRIGK
jgi:hypothetical protein